MPTVYRACSCASCLLMCHACSCAAGAGTSCFLTEVCFLLRKGHFTLAHGEEKDKKKADLTAMEG